MIEAILKLIRVKQWYKNLLVFLAVIFANKLGEVQSIEISIIAFTSMCLVYGAIYTFNDLIDLNRDTQHSSKKNRPLATGQISKSTAIAIGTALLVSGGALTLVLLPFKFALILAGIIALNVIYTLFLKRTLFVDIITIALLFVMRAVGGAVAINVSISPWLLICTFLLALFLAAAKRKTDLDYYNLNVQGAEKYTGEMLNNIITITTTGLLMSYSIYAFFTHGDSKIFWLSVPVAFFLGFRFMHLIGTNSKAARQAEEVFYDWQMITGMAIWLAIVVIGMYFK